VSAGGCCTLIDCDKGRGELVGESVVAAAFLGLGLGLEGTADDTVVVAFSGDSCVTFSAFGNWPGEDVESLGCAALSHLSEKLGICSGSVFVRLVPDGHCDLVARGLSALRGRSGRSVADLVA
jgi:hypothetical protein